MIKFQNVSFSYGAAPLLDGVNLEIGRHDFWAIVGANGCGKTTLLRLIMGQLHPSSGTIVRSEEATIGYLPQYSRIDKAFPMTVREAVSLGLVDRGNMFNPFVRSDAAPVDEAMERMRVAHLARKSVGRLSGGELQRVLLARAFVSRPAVLLLDEPSTYLDAASEERVYSLLCELNRDCAIVLVGHNVEALRASASFMAFVDGDVRVEKCNRADAFTAKEG